MVPWQDVAKRRLVKLHEYATQQAGSYGHDVLQYELTLLKPPSNVSYRKKISNGLRMRVLERDGFKCKKCGAQKSLTLDHIIPYVQGGPSTEENLQTLCRPCNGSKGTKTEI